MLDALDAWDKQALLFLNGLHAGWLDQIMFRASDTGVWIPMFIALLYLLWRDYRRRTLIILAGLIIVIVLCDQTASGLFKPLVKRLRPCNDPEIGHLVHIVNGYCSKAFSFFSSHASNAFGMAAYLGFFYFRRNTIAFWAVLVWAVLHSYTRLYLGVHYPGDLLAGAACGVGYGVGGAYLAKYLFKYLPV